MANNCFLSGVKKCVINAMKDFQNMHIGKKADNNEHCKKCLKNSSNV